LPDYLGTVVHDGLAVYDSYPASHALCGAHLLRELVAVNESDPDLLWPIRAPQALLALNSGVPATERPGQPSTGPRNARNPRWSTVASSLRPPEVASPMGV